MSDSFKHFKRPARHTFKYSQEKQNITKILLRIQTLLIHSFNKSKWMVLEIRLP